MEGLFFLAFRQKIKLRYRHHQCGQTKIAGNKLLDNVSVSKYNNGGQTILRVNFATATISQAILHITITSQGMMHYYDKRWKLVTP